MKIQLKTNKFSPNFGSEEFTVIERHGSEVLVRSKITGKQYRRNVTAIKKIPNNLIDDYDDDDVTDAVYNDDDVNLNKNNDDDGNKDNEDELPVDNVAQRPKRKIRKTARYQ